MVRHPKVHQASNTEQGRSDIELEEEAALKTIPLLEPLAADLERVERKMREPVHPEYQLIHLSAVSGRIDG